MHKKLILGVVLVLTLTLASPVTAAEEWPFTWPSFDVVEWVFGLFDLVGSLTSISEIGPSFGSGGDNPLPDEMASAESGSEPTQEVGPGYEPWD